jgi:tetratricopeptide (TPR) repeat protein
LASDPDNTAARIEAAIHLLDGGEESRGAEMLAALGMSLLSSVDFNASAEAVAALHRALQVFEQQGRSEYELAALLLPMMKLAYYTPHWKLILKYGERALAIGLRITGLAAANKLRPVFGPKLALRFGLTYAGNGFAREKTRGLSYDLQTAIVACCGILPAIVGTGATCLDTERVARIKRIVEPLTLFGPDHVAGIIYGWAPNQHLIVSGREGEARETVEESIARTQLPHVKAAMGEAAWRSQFGGLLFGRGLFDAYSFGDGALRTAAELEQLGIRVWAMAADQVRMLYHAFRGESEDVQRYRERVELFAVQGNTTWQAEMFFPALLLNADVLTGDAIAARRAWEQLARRTKDVQALKKYADAAQAAYLTLRGEIQQAIALYEQVLPEFPLRARVAYETTRAYYAEALNLAGDHARAKAVVLEVIDGMVDQDHRIVVHFLEAQRQLSLAEAGLGNHTEAIRILDELLAKHGHEDNRLLIGLLHKARAEVALLARDSEAFEVHQREMEQRFRGTRNPALIAQWERLVERATRLGVRKADPPAAQDGQIGLKSTITTFTSLAELSAAADPYASALQLFMSRVRATSGFLYLSRQNAMHLVAASGTSEPPAHLEGALKELADKAPLEVGECSEAPSANRIDDFHAVTAKAGCQSDETRGASPLESAISDDAELDETQAISDVNTQGNTVFVRSLPPPSPWGGYQLLLLDGHRDNQRFVVGGLILEAPAHQIARLSKEFLRGVARVLHDRHITTALKSTVEY